MKYGPRIRPTYDFHLDHEISVDGEILGENCLQSDYLILVLGPFGEELIALFLQVGRGVARLKVRARYCE